MSAHTIVATILVIIFAAFYVAIRFHWERAPIIIVEPPR